MSSNPSGINDGPLLPTRAVLDRYDICDRTLDRWLAKQELGFPRPLIINKRRYFREGQLRQWELNRATAKAGQQAA
jgi:hypothetical protein